MANQITVDGLETDTLQEIIDQLKAEFATIYGPDINTDSDSPDGQMIGIFAQAVIDNLDLLTQIYNQFDPDLAIGRTLDERVAFNGIQRLGGTYTMTNITIVVDRALNLQGLDLDIDDPDGEGYTVADGAGNQWILAESQTFPSSGTYVAAFRAKNNGAVETTPNTITNPVTIVLGVVSVNNPTVLTTLGINEETDAQLHLRRQQSVSLSSQGYLQSLLADLKNINGVTSAFIYENNTGSVDADGVPSHSIWVIVQGGPDDDIANAIYRKRNAGCGMKGSETVVITQVDDSLFVIRFDRTASEDLYIKFDASSLDGVNVIDPAYIKAQLVLRLVPGVNDAVNINQLATIVQQIDPNCLVTSAGFGLSGGGPFYDLLSPSAKNLFFAVAAGRIDITVL